MKLTDLSDEALLESLSAVCGDGHRVTARLIAHLVEVEERRLDLKAACTSLFDFCVRKLGMSEGAAFRRINAARLVRKFPRLLSRIERGEVALCTLVRIRDLLTEETLDDVLDEVAGKTQREVETIVARRAPKPDVPERVTLLPATPARSNAGDPSLPVVSSRPPSLARCGRTITPLSEDRYKVQLTASAREKLERARELMSHKHPDLDLAVVIEEALDALLERLERDRLGSAKPPRRGSRPAKPEHIRQSTRREVITRDGDRCTFVSERGERCPARAFLELDHIVPRATNGSSDASNLRVRCRAHNRLAAEEVFGREYVERAIDFRRRKSPRKRSAEEPKSEVSSDAKVAVRGLAALGFTKSDAHRAVSVVLAQAPTEAPCVERLLRDALRVLT